MNKIKSLLTPLASEGTTVKNPLGKNLSALAGFCFNYSYLHNTQGDFQEIHDYLSTICWYHDLVSQISLHGAWKHLLSP